MSPIDEEESLTESGDGPGDWGQGAAASVGPMLFHRKKEGKRRKNEEKVMPVAVHVSVSVVRGRPRQQLVLHPPTPTNSPQLTHTTPRGIPLRRVPLYLIF